MKCIHIITPVKDSIELTLQTVDAIMASDVKTPFTYTVYNDFSTEENTARLREASGRLGFELVNLADVTSHPSPNYLLILQMSQERAIAEEAGLVNVHSPAARSFCSAVLLFFTASSSCESNPYKNPLFPLRFK